jgi:hypothetical protein
MKTFAIGGESEVRRLGFGAMRITGKGTWGPPADPGLQWHFCAGRQSWAFS